MILIYYHTTDYWPVNIIKIHSICVYYFWLSATASTFLLLFFLMTITLLSFLTTRSWTLYSLLWFMRWFLILWIASFASTYFAASYGKFSFSYLIRNLTNTWFTWFWECFHTIFTASISSLKPLLLFLFILFFLIFLRMIFWILTSMNKILSGTSNTATSLTTLITEMCSSLLSRNYTYTCLFVFVSISMFTSLTTILISNNFSSFLLVILFRNLILSKRNLVMRLMRFILLNLFYTLVLPLFLIGLTAGWTGWRWKRWS